MIVRALWALTAVSVVVTLGIVLMLGVESVGFFAQVAPWRLVTDESWRPLLSPPSFGVWPLLSGTLLVTGLASALAFPLGLLGAIYLAELGPKPARFVLKPTLELLAGVPSVVLGYVALRHFTPALQSLIPGLPPFNALSAGLAMGFMLLPTFATLVDDAITSVPQGVREAAYALGANRMRTLFWVVLPAARSGISAAALLALSRAIGETMIVTIAAGAVPNVTFDPREPVQTVTAFMAQMAMGDLPFGSIEQRTLFALGLILFSITCTLNVLAHRSRARA